MLNIGANNEGAFRHVVEMVILIWFMIYSFDSINIHADDEYTFRRSCEYGSLAVAAMVAFIWQY